MMDPRRPPSDGALGRRLEELERQVALQDRQIRLLERERRKFAALVNHTDAGFLVVDRDLTVEWANPAAEAWFGLKPGAHRVGLLDAAGRADVDGIEHVVATIREVFEAGHVRHDELVVRGDGHARVAWITLAPVRGASGGVDQVMVMLQDVTDLEILQRSQAELEVSEEAFRSLATSSPLGIFRTDRRGGLVYTNPRWREFSGLDTERTMGWRWVDAIHGDDRAEVVARLRAAIDAGEPFDLETRVVRRRGGVRWIHLRGQPHHDETGAIAGWVGTAEDVTERRRNEERLCRARDAAEAASAAKSMFLANMSHEIRTPMNGVIGMAELLLQTDLDPTQRRFAEQVMRSARALLRIIDDILDYSKIEAGRLTLERVPFDLRQTLDDVVQLLAERARGNGTEIVLDYDPRLPVWLVGDPVRVRQIVMNLAGNAVKFTKNGRVTVGAALAGRRGATAEVRFTVSDTGVGIEPDALRRIFDAFTQADASTTRRFGGTGLGLTICRQLVDLMDGRIDVESTPGEGTTFTVELDLGVADVAPGVPAEAASRGGVRSVVPGVGGGVARGEADAAPTGEPGGAATGAPDERRAACAEHGQTADAAPGPRVLVAEDNAINREVAVLLLRGLGCEVDVARDGAEALRMATATRYAVVFMDCQMPEMDGYEATRRLRAWESQRGRRTPVVALTANAMQGDRERCLVVGMDDHVPKPLSRDALAAVLERFAGTAASS